MDKERRERSPRIPKKDATQAEARVAPIEGIFERLMMMQAVDPIGYKKDVLERIGKENPDLEKSVLFGAYASPKFEDNLRFSLMYYDIFSRSAMESGAPMLRVSEDLIISSIESTAQEVRGGDLEEEMEKVIAKEGGRRMEELKSSPELGNFWVMVAMYEDTVARVGEAPFLATSTLNKLSFLFEAQESANAFKRQFGGER